jgi:hypothetical protein
MPAIASLEELKMVRRDFRSMFLAASPYASHLTTYDGRFAMLFLRITIHGRMLIAVYVFELHLTTHALHFTVKETLYALQFTLHGYRRTIEKMELQSLLVYDMKN